MVTKSPFTCTPILNSRGITWQPSQTAGWSHVSNSLSLKWRNITAPKYTERVWQFDTRHWGFHLLHQGTWLDNLPWLSGNIPPPCPPGTRPNGPNDYVLPFTSFTFVISNKCLENWKLLWFKWSASRHNDIILMDNGRDLIIPNTGCCLHHPTLTVSGLDHWPTIFKPRRSIAQGKQGILRILLGTSANQQADQAIYVRYAVE